MTATSLIAHAGRLRQRELASLASLRAAQTDLTAAGWTLNTARQFLDADAQAGLADFATSRHLQDAIDRLFAGEIVNPSENRPALHWALRAQAVLALPLAETVRQSIAPADDFAAKVHSGQERGARGAPFQAIVHIGIGGSDFGPRLIHDALLEAGSGPQLRFCANLDPRDLDLALEGLDPQTTLVIGVSKSFGTEETLYNLSRARDWLRAALGADANQHIALVTANSQRARDWLGGEGGHLFDLPESVGGRFSIWSGASLACACAGGVDVLTGFRAGAAAMDDHVRTAPLKDNMAAQLALLDYWNTSAMGFPMRALLAYARRLRLLPAYLQQLEMESNGKSVTPEGQPVDGKTAPALWGGEGSIGQHSYHQWLHQGTHAIPAEFILALDERGDTDGKRALAAHALAQAEVLANGRSLADVQAEEPGLEPAVAAQKLHAGGRPSSFLTCTRFDAHALGALIALYEHRTWLAGTLWGLNPFDQWGVERGKIMAARLKPVLAGEGTADDPVTAHLSRQIGAAFSR